AVTPCDPELVRPGVPELMRMDVRYSGLLAAAFDHLLDSPVGHRPPAAVAEPQLRPPLLRVPSAGTQVPVDRQSALRSEGDAAPPATLPEYPGDLLFEVDVGNLLAVSGACCAQPGHLRQPHPGVAEDPD